MDHSFTCHQTGTIPAFTPQPQSITAFRSVLMVPTHGRMARLSWPGWLTSPVCCQNPVSYCPILYHIPCTVQQLPPYTIVRKGWFCQSLWNLLWEYNCYLLLVHICRVIVNLRYDVVVVICDRIKRDILPVVLSLCQDVDYEVRACMSRLLDPVARGLGYVIYRLYLLFVSDVI